MRNLPDTSTLDQIIRPRRLAERLGVSLTSLWRMRQRGELPEPITISAGAKGWRVGDIDRLLADADRPQLIARLREARPADERAQSTARLRAARRAAREQAQDNR